MQSYNLPLINLLWYNTLMLVDDIIITVTGGKGGDGKVSFRRNAQTSRGGPDGGSGGNGGDVFFQGINDITALNQFQYKKEIKAEEGVGGGKNNKFGRNGKSLTVQIPFGTLVTDLQTYEKIEIENESQILIAKGGAGGKGNNEFKTATLQAPRFAEKGKGGEIKKLRLELRLIADIGIIGLPNAGKSSLLAAVTHARPKIGNYAFTTLEPNLGVMQRFILADIPGLIEGAHSGRGLGIKFLKHIQKTCLLLHCIDASSENVAKDYQTVRNELKEYDKTLLEKTEIIVLTKTDLVTPQKIAANIKKLQGLHKEIIPFSMYAESQNEFIQTISHHLSP